MTTSLLSLANPRVQALRPYQPGKPIEEVQRELGLTDVIKLASNENPLGPSPQAVKAAANTLPDAWVYPDASGYALKQAISQHLNVTPEQLTLGNGSDNVLALIAQAFIKPDGDVVLSEYGFSTFSIITRANHGNPIIAPAKNWGHDLHRMKDAITPNTQCIFIANPNNPTGTWVNETDLTAFLEQVRDDIVVVLDEAYYEYVKDPSYPDTIALQKRFPNLITTRTFSKVYGLAGLRIGYGIANPELADCLNRVRLPFNVTTAGLAAAVEAIKDQSHVQDSLTMNQEGMDNLTHGLNDMSLDFIPSVGNFVTIDVKQSGEAVFQALLQQGVIVRPLTPYKMENHIRVTIGKPHEMVRFLEALKKVI